MDEFDDRPVSIEEWPYEVESGGGSWRIGDPNPTAARKDWCKAQQKRDPNFEWHWCGGRKEQVSPSTAAVLGNGVQTTASFTVVKKKLGSFFFFKRQQDVMLFKLTWK